MGVEGGAKARLDAAGRRSIGECLTKTFIRDGNWQMPPINAQLRLIDKSVIDIFVMDI